MNKPVLYIMFKSDANYIKIPILPGLPDRLMTRTVGWQGILGISGSDQPLIFHTRPGCPKQDVLHTDEKDP